MNRYSNHTQHETGYRWEIDAPEGLSVDDISNLQRALIDWTSDPSNESLKTMLEDVQYLEDYIESLSEDKLKLFRLMDIYIETVHDNASIVSFLKEV